MKPIKGMKTDPYGLPLMMQAWIDFIRWAIGEKEIRAKFQKETDIHIENLIPRNALDAMIDEATGYDGKEMIVAFCDWVTMEFWGIEEEREGVLG